LVVTLFLILLLVVGRYRLVEANAKARRNQAAAGGGRTAAPMSIVPETVGPGRPIGHQHQCAGHGDPRLATVTIRKPDQRLHDEDRFQGGATRSRRGDLLAEIDFAAL